MKRLLIILLILNSYLSMAQVTPTVIIKVANTTTVFNQNIPRGINIIDISTGKQYLTLLPIISTKAISTCTLNTDIQLIETTNNKVTAFSTPTDIQYPSAKLVSDQLNLHVNISDTAGMLGHYIKRTDTASMLIPYAKDIDVALKANKSTSLTINGSAQDLSANRTWNVGTVTSIATGYGITGGTITSTGTLIADSSVLLSKIRAGHDYQAKGTYEVPLTFSTGLTRTGNTITNIITQYTDALARSAHSLTTTGTSGAATYNSSTGVFNIPQYQAAGTYSTDIHGNITALNAVTGTNTGDNATNSQYSSLVSNATHTGDATGSTALTVVKIQGIGVDAATPTSGDYLNYNGTSWIHTGITSSSVGLGNVTNNAQWYASNHPTTVSGYGITDIASSIGLSGYLPLSAGSGVPLTGTLYGVNANLKILGLGNPPYVNYFNYLLSIKGIAATSTLVGGRFIISDFSSSTLEHFQSTTENQWRSNVGIGLSAGNRSTSDLFINASTGAVTLSSTASATQFNATNSMSIDGSASVLTLKNSGTRYGFLASSMYTLGSGNDLQLFSDTGNNIDIYSQGTTSKTARFGTDGNTILYGSVTATGLTISTGSGTGKVWTDQGSGVGGWSTSSVAWANVTGRPYIGTGSSNNYMGLNSGVSLSTGSNNTFLGYEAGYSTSTGYQNVFIGHLAGDGNVSGGDNVVIGFYADLAGTTDANEIVIGSNLIGNGSNTTTIGYTGTTKTYLKGAVIVGSFSSAPTGVTAGIYFDTGTNHFYGYDGSNWKQLDN